MSSTTSSLLIFPRVWTLFSSHDPVSCRSPDGSRRFHYCRHDAVTVTGTYFVLLFSNLWIVLIGGERESSVHKTRTRDVCDCQPEQPFTAAHESWTFLPRAIRQAGRDPDSAPSHEQEVVWESTLQNATSHHSTLLCDRYNNLTLGGTP